MCEDAKKVLTQALALSKAERATLAATLIESLEEEGADDIEAAWELEIKSRLDELDSGEIETIPWTELRKQIFKEIG